MSYANKGKSKKMGGKKNAPMKIENKDTMNKYSGEVKKSSKKKS